MPHFYYEIQCSHISLHLGIPYSFISTSSPRNRKSLTDPKRLAGLGRLVGSARPALCNSPMWSVGQRAKGVLRNNDDKKHDDNKNTSKIFFLYSQTLCGLKGHQLLVLLAQPSVSLHPEQEPRSSTIPYHLFRRSRRTAILFCMTDDQGGGGNADRIFTSTVLCGPYFSCFPHFPEQFKFPASPPFP